LQIKWHYQKRNQASKRRFMHGPIEAQNGERYSLTDNGREVSKDVLDSGSVSVETIFLKGVKRFGLDCVFFGK
jgi:hypothetical protein